MSENSAYRMVEFKIAKELFIEVSKESMPVSTNTDLPSKYPMKSLPENLKFDTANLKFAMSRDQIFLKNCKKIYI